METTFRLAEAKPPAARTLPFASTLLGDFVAVVVSTWPGG